VSDLAERDLDEIWYYIAKNSHSVEIANGIVESITAIFYCPRAPRKPERGATKSHPEFAACRLAITSSTTARAAQNWSSPASSTECAIRRSRTSMTIDSSQARSVPVAT